MNISQFDHVLVVLAIPPALEIQFIDWLLAWEDGIGFTSSSVSGHSSRHDHLSVAEQVKGRQRRIQFQVQLDYARLESFMADLVAKFAGADLHYSVAPLLALGHLGKKFQ